MRHWKKGLLAAVLCVVLALGLAIPVFGSSSTVYLMAVNDRVLETTAENIPAVVGGVLYVPYTMLSNQVNGINLGVSAMYSSTRRTVLVANGQRGIIFDTQTNTAQDLDGNAVSVRAMVRNSMVFVPIDYLCDYFGTISCSRIQTQYGILIRITNSVAVLDDRNFVDAAGNQLADSLRHYLSTVGPGGTVAPFNPIQPEPSAAPSQAELYLTFRAGSAAAECAQLVEGRSQRALFLFTLEDLAQGDGLVRRLAGAGHTLGLALTGEDADSCLAEAARGRELMAAYARYYAVVVSAPNLDESGREALTEAGYVLWDADVHGEDYASGRAMVEALDPRRVNYVELACGEGAAVFLRSALSAMEDENCRVYQATAPALG